MAYVPLTIPATESKSYPDVRITNLSISQAIAGGTIYVNSTMKRCVKDVVDPTKTIDAPDGVPGASFTFNFQLGVSVVYNDPNIYELMNLLYTIGLAEAVKQGLLEVATP